MSLKEVEKLAQNPAKKIHAIKLYRKITGQGLKDSKTAVEHFIENGYWLGFPSETSSQSESDVPDSDNPFAEVERFAKAGQKIQAIKEYRKITGQGLKDSKAAVEHFLGDGYWSGFSVETSTTAESEPENPFTEVERLVKADRRIHAIKEYREITGQGVKDSKDAVEYFMSKGKWPQNDSFSQKTKDTVDSFSYTEVSTSYRSITETNENISFSEQDIFNWLLKEAEKQTKQDVSTDSVAMIRLKEAAKKAKEELGVKSSTEVNLPFLISDSSGPKHFQATLTAGLFKQAGFKKKEAFDPLASQQEVVSIYQERLGLGREEAREEVQKLDEERRAQKQEKAREEEFRSSSSRELSAQETYEVSQAAQRKKQPNDILQMGCLIAALLGILSVMGGLVIYLLQ